ncbi:rhodanese-like domain-containing protein [Marinobacteraceae bacterium S3BR75-40.1]
MQLEKIKTEGIAHLSYMVIDGKQAAVIDPRRDTEQYLEKARNAGAQITHVFETHRNEDYVVGSHALAEQTGARVYHGPVDGGEAVRHANTVRENDQFDIGSARLRILETPGHTHDSISIALMDTDVSEQDPVAVFTGDTLFIGDVGRTDFYPQQREEMAAQLYHSLFDKLLPLGDGVMVLPAHGAGSVCGNAMADREFSTLGFERQQNPRLQLSRDEFIKAKSEEHHYIPPYFEAMEEANQNAPGRSEVPHPLPLGPSEFGKALENGALAVDLRTAEAYCGAHIPGSLSLPADVIPAYAGWMLRYDQDLVLIADGPAMLDSGVHALYRLGFDRIQGYLQPDMTAWEASGADYRGVPTLSAKGLKARYDEGEAFALLDVRSIEEFEAGHLRDATHLYLGHLPDQLKELPRERPIVTFCGSGKRASVAASLLLRHGFRQVENCLGSMQACKVIGCD